jgi:hypothetical protein
MSQDLLRERGKRLKLLINMSGLDVIEFAKITQIGTSTLRNWIKGRANGLSEKGARKIYPFLLKKNIQCDLNWLLHEKGNPPRFSQIAYGHTLEFPSSNHSEDYFHEERQLFLNRYADTVITVVRDDSMKPFFEPEDHVGGIFLKEEKMSEAIGKNCIVLTQNQEILIGKVTGGTTESLYTLHQLNLDSLHFPLVRTDLRMEKMAPIIRIWKKSLA